MHPRDTFETARHEAFLNAVNAWNEVDKSERHRIPGPKPEHISVPDQPGVAEPADRDLDSDSDSISSTSSQGSDSEEERSQP